MKPEINKFPIEIFGGLYNDKSNKFFDNLKTQTCPYIDRVCTKPRKSEPLIKVGICTVGYKGDFLVESEPVIICPNRFYEKIVFDTISDKFLHDWKNVKWIKEVNLGVGGNVDFVAVDTGESEDDILDFYCIEFQAAGTTGSPYPAVQDLLQYKRFTKNSYNFGINWANEFMKTMMQQVYKKGKIVDYWGRKIIFVIQDVAMKYLESVADMSEIFDSDESNPIFFITFALEWDENNNRFKLVFKKCLSTTLEGINKILGGANPEHYLSTDGFINNIKAKGKADGVLNF